MCCKTTENMADITDAQISDAVKKYYLSDEFIKNISLVASQLQTNGLRIPGNLEAGRSFNLLPCGAQLLLLILIQRRLLQELGGDTIICHHIMYLFIL